MYMYMYIVYYKHVLIDVNYHEYLTSYNNVTSIIRTFMPGPS